jgi:hypothetical protein
VWAIGEDHKPNITGCGFPLPPDTCQIAGGLNAQFIISANHKTFHLHKDNICKCNVLWLAEIIGAIVTFRKFTHMS